MDNYDRFKDPKHINWAKAVKKRDNYTCRVCGVRNVYLHSHHQNSFDWCIEQRFDINNGVTLCQTCHDRYHIIFGLGKNTKLQFEEFLYFINFIKEVVKSGSKK